MKHKQSKSVQYTTDGCSAQTKVLAERRCSQLSVLSRKRALLPCLPAIHLASHPLAYRLVSNLNDLCTRPKLTLGVHYSSNERLDSSI